MNIVVSRKRILENITGKPRKFCLECDCFFDLSPQTSDAHATHYGWFLPRKKEEFESWVEHIRERSDTIWGCILDEDGTDSYAFCPTDFTLEITE